MSYSFSCIGPDDELRIRDEHSFLGRQLGEVIRLAEADDRKGCELVWALFTRELEQHMLYEENLLFPAFARTGVGPEMWASRLRADHEELRRQCRTLGNAILQPTLLVEPFPYLACKLVEHQEREGRVLYPWLACLSPAQASWGAQRLVVPPPDYGESPPAR